MKVVRCKNNHFFDVDSYSVCPHCGEPAGDVSTVVPKSESGHKKGFFWSRNKNSEGISTATGAGKNTRSDKTESILERQDIIQEAVNRAEVEDMPMRPGVPQTNFQNQMMDEQTTTSPQSVPQSQMLNGQQAARPKATVQPVPQGQMLNGQQAVRPQTTAQPVPQGQMLNGQQAERPQTAGLRQAIQQASANTEGKTMSYFSAAVAGNAAAKNSVPSEPVVGWLVCVKGNHFGESFQIYAGRNSIGRAEDNRIVMAKDNSVSRSKHAFVIYEPKKHHFFVQPGDSSGLTYLNDDYISEMKELKAFDSIELGESVLKFVPLCGDNFNWDEYITERG